MSRQQSCRPQSQLYSRLRLACWRHHIIRPPEGHRRPTPGSRLLNDIKQLHRFKHITYTRGVCNQPIRLAMTTAFLARRGESSRLSVFYPSFQSTAYRHESELRTTSRRASFRPNFDSKTGRTSSASSSSCKSSITASNVASLGSSYCKTKWETRIIYKYLM